MDRDEPIDDVRALQERVARALPALHIENADGWWLRYAPHCAWWVGTVLPHSEATGERELQSRVLRAEAFYAALDAEPRFQITPGVCPDGLDALLAGRGYRQGNTMSLRVAEAARVLERIPPASQVVEVEVGDRPTPDWFDIWHSVNGGDRRAECDLLERVDRPSAYVRAIVDDTVVAVGRAVADTGWAGVFGMATLPKARGKGAARSVLAAVAAWSGTGRLYLQVERDNLAATRLYDMAGFTELSTYHYRGPA